MAADQRPRVDVDSLGVGIVHLGLGAFHRAHQAEFTEDAIAAAGGDWAICGVSPRGGAVASELAGQDGLYTVLTRGPQPTTARVVGTVRETLDARADPGALLARLADPRIRIITLTVTEKGYRHDPSTGRLRRDDPRIRADAAGDAPAETVVGRIARGLQARMRADAGPCAVLSCDNLAGNGAILRGLVDEFVELLPTGDARSLREWIDAQVRFPSSMVDRIVPAPTDADRADVQRLIGLRDDAAVATEAFRQWVVEDDFPGGRPAWQRAGALLIADVTPYEQIKLRTLNAAHSTLAYLGLLDGRATIADAVARPAFAAAVGVLWRTESGPTLDVPEAFDLDRYQKQLLDRFANPALHHATAQVAADGSQKLPQRLLTTVRATRAAGREPHVALLAVAAWARWLQLAAHVDDPLADVLRRAVADEAPGQAVDRLLGVGAVFGDDLATDGVVREILVDTLHHITTDGPDAAARAAVEASEGTS